MSHPHLSPPVVLRRMAVEARTGLCRSAIYQKMADGQFPKPINLGLRAVGWLEEDVNKWIADRVAASKKGV